MLYILIVKRSGKPLLFLIRKEKEKWIRRVGKDGFFIFHLV